MDDVSVPPPHTCPEDAAGPSLDCLGCTHAITRFRELFPLFLALAREVDADTHSSELARVVEEFDELGLTPTVWIHCACIATQLANKPLTVDRTTQSLAALLAADPGYGVATVDALDKMLTHAGLDDLDAAHDVAVELIDSNGTGAWLLGHMLMAALATHQINTELGLWQQTVHWALYADVKQSINLPGELLTAARISGCLLDGDIDAYHQLIARSMREAKAHLLLRIWTFASAEYHETIRCSIVRADEHGMPEGLLNLDGDLSDDHNSTEKAFMIVARMVRAIAERDPAVLVSTRNEIEKWVSPELVLYVIHAASQFHSQLMYAAYQDQVADHREKCAYHHGQRDPGDAGHDPDKGPSQAPPIEGPFSFHPPGRDVPHGRCL